MSKFFVRNEQIQDNKIIIQGEDVNHIANVLRLQKQDKIFICDKEKNITYQTEIVSLSKEEVECKILKQVEESRESFVQVTIFQGLPKADKMEYIIQKSTELGVNEITPVAMKRCIVKLEGKDASKKRERWQKIAEMAAKQSGRDKIPEINAVIRFKDIIEMVSKFDLFLIAYEEEKQNTLKTVLQELKKQYQNEEEKQELKIGVVIGPEGGIEKDEVEQLQRAGARSITLGKRILRTETASLAILSNVMYEFED